MKALLLAAGKATRLGDLSITTPKCLHMVGGETLLNRLLGQLTSVGVTEVMINTHYLANQIEEHIHASAFRDVTTTVYEPSLLGTLGTLKANLGFFEDQGGWVLHADNYISCDLENLAGAYRFRPAWCEGVLLTFTVQNGEDFGIIECDAQRRLLAFHEKVLEPPTNQASAATFIFGREALEVAGALPASATDISRDLIPALVGRLQAVPHSGPVVDIGTPAGLQAARRLAGIGLEPRKPCVFVPDAAIPNDEMI